MKLRNNLTRHHLITTTQRRGTSQPSRTPYSLGGLCYLKNLLFGHFQKMKETRAELTFAKTSGTVTRDRKNNWPIAHRHVPSNDPRNNCGTHLISASVPFSFLGWRMKITIGAKISRAHISFRFTQTPTEK